MQLAKWGNSLAVRIPAEIVKKLGWKEGDELHMELSRNRIVELYEVASPDEIFARLEQFKGTMPEDFKFDRDAANSRTEGE
jgi:antitoxin MazE